MNQTDTFPAPRALLDAIAEGEAGLAAGRVVEIDVDALCAEIEAEADAMVAGQHRRGTPSAA